MDTNRQEADPQPALRARIGRTRDGMFRADYTSAPNADRRAAPTMPDSPVMLTEGEQRAWVEQIARWSGFSHVAWEDGGTTGETPPLRF